MMQVEDVDFFAKITPYNAKEHSLGMISKKKKKKKKKK
jgi:hypothetical protein